MKKPKTPNNRTYFATPESDAAIAAIRQETGASNSAIIRRAVLATLERMRKGAK